MAGILLGLTAIALLAPAGRRALARRAGGLVAMTISAILSWIALDAMVGYAAPSLIAEYHCRAPHLDVTFKPQADIMPGITGESRYSTNAFGIRGPEFPPRGDAYRILCVGGSTTECIYIDDRETWTQRLMDDLNAAGGRKYWSGGVGVSGNSTAHHLKFLRESPLVDEIDALVFLIGINDYFWAYSGMEDRYATEVPSYPAYPWWARSNVHRVAVTELADTKRDVTSVRESFLKTVSTEDFLGKYYIQRRKLRREAEITADMPDLTQSLLEYQDRVRTIIEFCRNRRIGVLFATQPVLWRDDLSDDLKQLIWFGRLADGRYLEIAELRKGMDRYNAALVEVCADMHAPLVDLTDMTGQPEYFYDDCHFNELGAKIVGDRIAAWFQTHPEERE